MANEEQLKRIREQGVEAWNKWRRENPYEEVDLSGAILWEENLNGANLREANLVGANFVGADLHGVDLKKTKLGDNDFSGANLSETNLENLDLKNLDFRGSKFHNSNLNKADLRGADLRLAEFNEASLFKADLSEAKLQGSYFNKAHLCKTKLARAFLIDADFRGAILDGTDLSNSMMFGAHLEGATIVDCRVSGVSAWNLKLDDKTKQRNLIITTYDQPAITVDNLEVAQFIYLLINYKKIRDVINSVTERGVLILGRFGGGGIEILQSIAEKLRQMKYLPIIFDFDRPSDRNYTETVKTLAGLSRFVIVDLSGPSVPQELYATVPHYKIPFVPIIEGSRKDYSMFRDICEYPWVLKPIVKFENKEQLIDLIFSRIVEPAEAKCKERQAELDRLFNRKSADGK